MHERHGHSGGARAVQGSAWSIGRLCRCHQNTHLSLTPPLPPSLPHPLTHPLVRWIRFVRHSQNKQTLSFSQSACFDICIHFKVRLNTENTKTSNLNQTSVCWSTSKINLIRVRVPLMNPQSDTLQMRLMVTFAPLFGFEVALKCLWRAHLITHRPLLCPLLHPNPLFTLFP